MRRNSRERAPPIRTLLEDVEDTEEFEPVPVPVQQTITVSTSQTTDSVTVRALVEPNAVRSRQHFVRRSSSAVEMVTMPAPNDEKEDAGDKSLRPRFLQERSATIVHITPAATDPSCAPRSRASAFLMDVLAKKGPSLVESRRTSLEPRPGVTNTLRYVPPEGVERGLPLRVAPRHSRRFGRQLSVGPSSETLERVIPEGARKRRVSASEEHMAAIVRALQASKQQLQQQLDILHSVLRFINANERDEEGKRPVLKEMVDVGMLSELASIMREFRFHPGMQVCIMSILSALAEESNVYAYMMSEFNVEKLLQKNAAIHASHDRLLLLASSLVHTIEESKHSVNVAAYQAEKAARLRQQSASYADMVVAAISSKPKPSLPPSTGRRTCKQLSMAAAEVARSRALIGSASPSEGSREKLSFSHSAGRQRREFALEVAPPALSANYRLLFSQKLKKVGVLPLPAAGSDSNEATPVEEKQMKRDRPASSPSRASLPLDLTSKALIAAIYSGVPVFVEPSPLAKRMPYRGSSSAGGVRRRLSAPKKIQRIHTEQPPPTQQFTSASLARSPSEPKIIKSPLTTVVNGRLAESGEEEARVETVTNGDDDEDSYEDDFDTTGDESDGDKKMPDRKDNAQIGSDGELIDLLHGMSRQNTESNSSLTPAEVDAATTIQRHVRGVLVRRELGRSPSTKVSGKTVTQGKKTPRRVKPGNCERRGLTSKGAKAKRIPLSARAHQQLSSRRDSTRCEANSRAAGRVRPATAMALSPGRQTSVKSKTSAQGEGTRFQQRKQGSNNQLLSPSKSSLLGRSSLNQSLSSSLSLSGFETEQKAEEAEVTVRERPDPDALKQIQTLYAEGLQRHKDSHLGLAIECYERALAIPGGQGFASLHLNLGSALMAQTKFPEALASFEQAKRIQPSNVKTLYNYSLALLHLGRPHEAQLLLRRILEVEPSHEKATIALSHLQGGLRSPTAT